MADINKLDAIEIGCDPNLESTIRSKIINNLSGACLSHQGKFLWLGTDEFSSIERFTRQADNSSTYTDHQRFSFKDFIDGFDEDKGEVDIEGLDYNDGYLWAIGSHSSKRKKVDVSSDKFTIEKKELKKIEREENRYILVRIPINEAGEIETNSPDKAWLKRDGSSNSLIKALAKDEYLDLSLAIETGDRNSLSEQELYFYLPSKENGFDIEGLAVKGNKLAIGLRGPVLRGIAILLEIEVEAGSNRELELKQIGDDNKQYKRHFLDLNGLGIRELCWDKNDKDLLVLAGPTMSLDGAHSLFRLDNPFNLENNSLSSQQNGQLKYLGNIPHGEAKDRAEGLTIYGEDKKSILVVYDSPTQERLILDERDTIIGVRADIFNLDNLP